MSEHLSNKSKYYYSYLKKHFFFVDLFFFKFSFLQNIPENLRKIFSSRKIKVNKHFVIN